MWPPSIQVRERDDDDVDVDDVDVRAQQGGDWDAAGGAEEGADSVRLVS